MPIVDGTEGSADDKPRVEVEDRGEIQLAAPANHELRRVADPPPVGTRRLELPIEHIRRDRLIIVVERKRLRARAWRPSSRIRRAMRFSPTCSPSSRRSFQIRGRP